LFSKGESCGPGAQVCGPMAKRWSTGPWCTTGWIGRWSSLESGLAATLVREISPWVYQEDEEDSRELIGGKHEQLGGCGGLAMMDSGRGAWIFDERCYRARNGETQVQKRSRVWRQCSRALYIAWGRLAEAAKERRWRRPVVLHKIFGYSKWRRRGAELTNSKEKWAGLEISFGPNLIGIE
jgi:hypothetical protein